MLSLVRRAALPLGWYYAVTLALPLANGAGELGAAFVEHAVVVVVVPPALIVSAYAVLQVARACRKWTHECHDYLRRCRASRNAMSSASPAKERSANALFLRRNKSASDAR